MANGVLFNSSGSIVLAVNYTIQGPYAEKFLARKDTKTLTLESEAYIRVGNAILIWDTDVDIDESDLDAGAAYAGSTTYYVYACQPLDGSGVPVLKISANATYPAGGWNADTSRKIGGFMTDGSGNIAATGNALWDLRTVDVTHTGVTDSMIPAGEISFSKIKQAEMYSKGSSTFAGSAGRTITHSLGTTNYHVLIEPSASPAAFLGELYYSKAANTVVIYNSGSDVTTAFDYLLVLY
jgi:hypothetical protein